MSDATTRPPGLALVHVMKTGGTTINRALRPDFDPSMSYPYSDEVEKSRRSKWHVESFLTREPSDRSRLRFVSVHMPAWVVQNYVEHLPTATVLRDPVERTLSHLHQLARDYFTEWSLEQIWDYPPVRKRLANYQTQIFGATEDDYEQRKHAAVFEELNDTERQAIREEVIAVGLTGIEHTSDVDPTFFKQAVDRLDSIDFVGITEDLQRLVTELSSHLGRDLGPQRHARRGDRTEVGSDLRHRIEAACSHDAALYQRACDRIAHHNR